MAAFTFSTASLAIETLSESLVDAGNDSTGRESISFSARQTQRSPKCISVENDRADTGQVPDPWLVGDGETTQPDTHHHTQAVHNPRRPPRGDVILLRCDHTCTADRHVTSCCSYKHTVISHGASRFANRNQHTSYSAYYHTQATLSNGRLASHATRRKPFARLARCASKYIVHDCLKADATCLHMPWRPLRAVS